jgi:hypothetical protein
MTNLLQVAFDIVSEAWRELKRAAMRISPADSLRAE